MSQRIYENFMGILGITEIYVASQPKANMTIPLIEKGIFEWNENYGWVWMDMA